MRESAGGDLHDAGWRFTVIVVQMLFETPDGPFFDLLRQFSNRQAGLKSPVARMSFFMIVTDMGPQEKQEDPMMIRS